MTRSAHNGVVTFKTTLLIGAAIASMLVPAAGARTHATLRIADFAPLSVAGAGFRSHESVKVTATMNGRTWSKTLSATTQGTFVASWRSLRFDPCATPAVVSAHGVQTGTVIAKFMAPECASP